MDYAEAVAAFFVPRRQDTALPVAVAEGSPARRLRDACEPVAMHAVWSRVTNERRADGRPQDAVHCLWWAGPAEIPLARPTVRAYSEDMKVSFTCAAARAIGSPVAAA